MMTKIYNTLGRSRGKKELENNHFGDDMPVSLILFCVFDLSSSEVHMCCDLSGISWKSGALIVRYSQKKE